MFTNKGFFEKLRKFVKDPEKDDGNDYPHMDKEHEDSLQDRHGGSSTEYGGPQGSRILSVMHSHNEDANEVPDEEQMMHLRTPSPIHAENMDDALRKHGLYDENSFGRGNLHGLSRPNSMRSTSVHGDVIKNYGGGITHHIPANNHGEVNGIGVDSHTGHVVGLTEGNPIRYGSYNPGNIEEGVGMVKRAKQHFWG